jgi:hypothetical protein
MMPHLSLKNAALLGACPAIEGFVFELPPLAFGILHLKLNLSILKRGQGLLSESASDRIESHGRHVKRVDH